MCVVVEPDEVCEVCDEVLDPDRGYDSFICQECAAEAAGE
jgi:hypothetical protein